MTAGAAAAAGVAAHAAAVANAVKAPYKGLGFWTQSRDKLVLPSRAEVIAAKSIAMPEM